MGCNTSQELKTKDNATISVGNDDDLLSNPEHNAMTNGLDHGIVNGHGGSSSGSSSELKPKTQLDALSRLTPPSSAQQDHHNTKKTTNVILSNGDMIKYTKGDSCSSAGTSFEVQKNAMDDVNSELGEDEAKAATKIQAVFRGHQVRSTMKKSETSSTTTNNTKAASNNGAAAAAAAAEPEPTKEELEAEFDPNNKELCDAALKIQSTFRGHMSRKLANKEEHEDVDIQEITKKVAEELDIDLTDPELNKAATKIQASFRGHKIRKDITPLE